MLLQDLKRKSDERITKDFLKNYKDHAKELAKLCADKLDALAKEQGDGATYYLKGGNAISVLDPVALPLTGDWDFQFKPGKGVLKDWKNKYETVDAALIRVLCEVAQEFANGLTADEIKTLEEVFTNFKDDALEGSKPVNAHVPFAVAPQYKLLTNAEILTHENFKKDSGSGDSRLQLSLPADITQLGPNVVETGRPKNPLCAGKLQPCIYANYSIPGFVLYRLAVRFTFNLKQATEGHSTVTLKSEVIDIGVPREGSAAVHLAQEGVVTEFIDKDGFRIPGWGYHFYENINMIEDIQYGVSTGAHKAKKRVERGTLALEKLKALNPQGDVVLSTSALIDRDDGQAKTKSFTSVMINMVKSEGDLTSLVREIGSVVSGRLKTAATSNSKQPIQQLVDLDFKSLTRPTVSEVAGSLIGPLRLEVADQNQVQGQGQSFNAVIQGRPPEDAKSLLAKQGAFRTDFKLVSPLVELMSTAIFPLPFVIVEVVKDVFENLTIAQHKSFDTEVASGTVKIWRLKVQTRSNSESPLYIRVAFVKRAKFSTYQLASFLDETVLWSQRKALADAYEAPDVKTLKWLKGITPKSA